MSSWNIRTNQGNILGNQWISRDKKVRTLYSTPTPHPTHLGWNMSINLHVVLYAWMQEQVLSFLLQRRAKVLIFSRFYFLKAERPILSLWHLYVSCLLACGLLCSLFTPGGSRCDFFYWLVTLTSEWFFSNLGKNVLIPGGSWCDFLLDWFHWLLSCFPVIKKKIQLLTLGGPWCYFVKLNWFHWLLSCFPVIQGNLLKQTRQMALTK